LIGSVVPSNAVSDIVVASIVIPVYNNEAFIEDTLSSAMAQSEALIEIIVCDDGSTDSSPKIIARAAERDHRVVVLRNQQNRGVSFTRNRAIAAARGKWIVLLDGDDRLHRDHVKHLCRFAEQHEADMVANCLVMIDKEGKETGHRLIPTQRDGQRLQLREFVKDGMPSAKRLNFGYLKPLIRRDFIVRNRIAYEETAWCGEDFMFYFSCLLRGADFRLMRDALYFYRKFPKQHGLEKRLSRIRQNRLNNRILMSAACEQDDILPLMRMRDRYFGYSERFELFKEAMMNRNLRDMRRELAGGPAYLLFVFRQVSTRTLVQAGRFARKRRRAQTQE
jgi:succinoglycan biosynthesis protein ExoO